MSKSKILLISLATGTVTFVAGMWLYFSRATMGAFEYAVAGFVLMTVIFGFVVGLKKLSDEKKGFPADDELSISIKLKAGAMAFLCSFYLWTFVMIFLSGSNMDVEVIIGIGVLGMAVLFLGFWTYYSQKGIGDAHSN
ncbi:MAG: hypothetical protein KJP00_15795 [Bacteroidia bacterium]|nr:hypothetical protein [Bacteroidia bacterium]